MKSKILPIFSLFFVISCFSVDLCAQTKQNTKKNKTEKQTKKDKKQPADTTGNVKKEYIKDNIKETADDIKGDAVGSAKEIGAEITETSKEVLESTKQIYGRVKEETTLWFNDNIKANTVGAYTDTRKQNNHDYGNYLRQDWESYSVKLDEDVFTAPKSEKRTQIDTLVRSNINIQFVEPLLNYKKPVPEGYSKDADILSGVIGNNKIVFDLYGVKMDVFYDPDMSKMGFGKLSYDKIATFWQRLAETKYELCLYDLYELKNKCGLSDWAYYKMIAAVAEKIYPKNKNGERDAFTVFMLNQSGYDARMALIENEEGKKQMVLLLAVYERLYSVPYIDIDGKKYYLFTKLSARQLKKSILSYTKSFAKAIHPVSIRIEAEKFNLPALYERTAGLTYDFRLTQIYNDVPTCQIGVYAEAKAGKILGKYITHRMYLRIDTIGTTQDKIDYITSFVNDNFNISAKKGYAKRCLFVEQVLSLKAGDIRDKAIFKALLIKELLDLPVMLVAYPNYYTLAVASSEIDGLHSFVGPDNLKYTLLDNLSSAELNIEARGVKIK